MNVLASFAYRAQTGEGQGISGTIDAADETDATHRLASLNLRVLDLHAARRPGRAAALRGDDFIAFNQQLAQLTRSGLPVEHGLRLIAQDIRRGSMRRTIQQVVADLESGRTLPQAIEAHRKQFPPLYGELIEAGIRAGNLPGVLLNMGRHLTLVSRLRSALWRALSYPALVFIIFFGLFLFLFLHVIPQFEPMYRDIGKTTGFGWRGPTLGIPPITYFALQLSHFLSQRWVWTSLACILGLAIVAWIVLRLLRQDEQVAEAVGRRLPLIGPVLRCNLISRWCDAVGIGVDAGLDLPAAIKLADDAMDSPPLASDGRALLDAMVAGRPLVSARPGTILPATVPAAMDLASNGGNLAETLTTLSQLYQQQAELRLGSLQGILTPIFLVVLGSLVAIVIIAMLAPMLEMLQSFTRW